MPTKDRISKTPGVCGSKACIAGHRVRVLDIVEWHEHQGLTPDEIVSEVPSNTLADVHAALAYCHAEGVAHSGIVHCHQGSVRIGEMLRHLVFVYDLLSSEERVGKIEFL